MPSGNFFSTNQKHYQDLGSARHQYGISALVTQTSFCEGSSGDLAKRRLFSQATTRGKHKKSSRVASPRNFARVRVCISPAAKSPSPKSDTTRSLLEGVKYSLVIDHSCQKNVDFLTIPREARFTNLSRETAWGSRADCQGQSNLGPPIHISMVSGQLPSNKSNRDL